MLTELAMLCVTGLIAFLGAFLGGKLLMFLEKKDIKEQIFDYLESTDAIEMLATLGAAFAHGAMSQLKLGKGAGKSYTKLFGFKIPQSVVDSLVAKVLGKYIGTEPSSGGLEEIDRSS